VYVGVDVMRVLFLSDFNENRNMTTGFFFIKISTNTKFHQNLSGGSRSVACGRTDMRKLTVAFCPCVAETPERSSALKYLNFKLTSTVTFGCPLFECHNLLLFFNNKNTCWDSFRIHAN
jgi:hypothetical protein